MIISFNKIPFNRLATVAICFKKTIFENTEPMQETELDISDMFLFDDGSNILFDNNQNVLT